MDGYKFVISMISYIISFPILILILFIYYRNEITNLFSAIKILIEEGRLNSIKIGSLQLEWSSIEHFKLNAIASPNLDDLDYFHKSTYEELPKIIEEAFGGEKGTKILNVNLNKKIGTAPLYLYVRRLNHYFDLKIITFVKDNKFVGFVGNKEIIFLLEKEYPRYNGSYQFAIDKSREFNINELFDLERAIIDDFRRERGKSDLIDMKFINSKFGGLLFKESLRVEDKFSKYDLIKLAEFNHEFIPIIVKNNYKGVLEKQKLVQNIFLNYLKETIK